MAKKVLILSGSPRVNGNTDRLCDEFMRGAQEVGHSVEKVSVSKLKIGFCMGCYFCQRNNGVCAIKDDMAELLNKMVEADVIVLSSPVYFYSISAQLKAVIDRTVARWLDIKNKEFYYIMASAEDAPTTMDCTLDCFRGFASCLEDSREMGVVYAKGVYERDDVLKTPYLVEAYEMGKRV